VGETPEHPSSRSECGREGPVGRHSRSSVVSRVCPWPARGYVVLLRVLKTRVEIGTGPGGKRCDSPEWGSLEMLVNCSPTICYLIGAADVDS
jgi:hypothetical protein